MSAMVQCVGSSPACSPSEVSTQRTDEVLRVEGLRTEFQIAGAAVPIVNDLNFIVRQGRCLALVGESGCGKSMTAMSLMRLVPRPGRITAGKIMLAGRNLRDLDVIEMRKVRGQEASMIFQEPMTSLHPVMRVGAQVSEAIRLHEKVSRKAARARGIEAFEQVGIPDPVERYEAFPHQLSGGLKQRVMIAMAIVTRPRLLIADEPTTALDVTIQAQILKLLQKLMRETHTAVLMITHDLGVVNQIADDLCVMYDGKIVEQGPCRSTLKNPQHAYTQKLLACLPQRNVSKKRRAQSSGSRAALERFPSREQEAQGNIIVGSSCQGVMPNTENSEEGIRSASCVDSQKGQDS